MSGTIEPEWAPDSVAATHGAAGLAVAGVLVLILFGLLSRIESEPDPPNSFSFAVLGDAPYSWLEERNFEHLIDQLNDAELDFVVHVGDIMWGPCTDERYRSRLDYFRRIRHPVVYTPGDNEWADCHEHSSSPDSPLDSLRRLRSVFFRNPTMSLGGQPLPLATQAGRQPYPEFPENARWSHRGTVFATAHLVGSRNARESFPGRTAADDAASIRRTLATSTWTRSTFETARSSGAKTVVLAIHADTEIEQEIEDSYRVAYEPFLTTLEEQVASFAGRVLLIHGDGHEYKTDRPLVRRTTGRRLEHLTRLEVPGSPDVAWVRVIVPPGANQPFRFEAHHIPFWLLW